jgi:hypothetical protein
VTNGTLINIAVSSVRQNYWILIMNELKMNYEGNRRKRLWPNLTYSLGIQQEELRKYTKNLSQDSQCPGRDSKCSPLEFKCHRLS